VSDRRRIVSRTVKGALGDPTVWVAMAFVLAVAIGCTWSLPGSDSWSADSISPRSCGLGAIVQTYWPGHFHTYPPLHMALLTVASLPWMGLAATRVGSDAQALEAELIKPLYMTAIEAEARVISAAMALGIVLHTMRLWKRLAGRRAGLAAGAIVAANATLVYYAHTGNLEVPYLFWTTWAMVEMDRVMAGERREVQALLLAVAAVLTKDQAAAALLIPMPMSLWVVPWARSRVPLARSGMILGGSLAVGAYALGSGALTNPVGFGRRVAFLLGPASQTWAGYARTFRGSLSLARDAFLATPHFASWPLCLAAALGVSLAAMSKRGLPRARKLAPLAAGASFALFFTLGARRSEDRFLLPPSVFFFPYAALAFDAAWTAWPRARGAIAGAAAAALAPAVLAVASIDATLLADPRYEAERFLRGLGTGTHVEVYGGPIFMPRVPAWLVTTRPGVEPLAERQKITGIVDMVDPVMDPRTRSPSVIVLATELSSIAATEPPTASHPFGLMQYGDATSHAFFRALLDGSLGYVRALRAVCTLPWPLECRRVHDSTAGEVWVYVRSHGVSMRQLSAPATGPLSPIALPRVRVRLRAVFAPGEPTEQQNRHGHQGRGARRERRNAERPHRHDGVIKSAEIDLGNRHRQNQ